MKRRPSPALITTALPALATLLSQCTREPAQRTPNPPPPPEPPPPTTVDAGSVDHTPVRVDPSNVPTNVRGGAIAIVSPQQRTPPPAPMAAPTREAVAPAAPAAPAEPGVYIVHNHPPGTPCHPVSQTELRQATANAGVTH